jgi:hypothetical protein
MPFSGISAIFFGAGFDPFRRSKLKTHVYVDYFVESFLYEVHKNRLLYLKNILKKTEILD